MFWIFYSRKEKMLITKLDGGLGNQMFQYACGLAAALRAGQELFMDLSAYAKSDFRSYELDVFGILPKPYPGYLKPFIQSSKNSLLDPLKPIKRFKEKRYYSYYEDIKRLKGASYIDGYWQSEKYFVDFEVQIRETFEFKKAPDGQNTKVASQIKSADSISLHVRRTDYISNTKANSFHGVCQIEYYKKAIELICQKISDPHFFIFSDDSEWCAQNFDFLVNKTIVSHNTGAASFEDMRLMSLCDHNIIANSSFSWWGAWLNANPDKIVVAPSEWLGDKSYDTSDVYARGWVVL
jgi:hypothetical protein